MIHEQTAFVLGAGSSQPYNFGVGRIWRSDIIKDFLHDFKFIYEETAKLADLVVLKQSAKNLIEAFEGANINSIDQFLFHRDDKIFTKFGKMAIILSIKKYEKNCDLPWKNINLDGDWYTYLYNEMVSEKSLDSFCKNEVAFITFNYDRSLEHFLFHNLKHDFGASQEEVIEALSNIPILHVYGQIAPLPWQPNTEHYIKFHDEFITFNKLESCITNIHIMGEENEDESITEARKILANFERIIFLGFGYSKENLHRLNMPGIMEEVGGKIIYGTGLGLKEREIRRCQRNFVPENCPADRIGPIKNNIHILEDCDCLDLLKHRL